METAMKETFFRSTGRKIAWDNLLESIVRHNDRSFLTIADKSLIVLYVTENYYEYPDLKGESIIGRHLYDIFPNPTPEWKDINIRVLTGESIRYDNDIFIRSDGGIEHLRWACFPWYDTGGKIGGLVLHTTLIDDPSREDEARLKREADLREEEREKACREKLKSAWKMKSRGYPDDDIADILSLRREDVAAL